MDMKFFGCFKIELNRLVGCSLECSLFTCTLTCLVLAAWNRRILKGCVLLLGSSVSGVVIFSANRLFFEGVYKLDI